MPRLNMLMRHLIIAVFGGVLFSSCDNNDEPVSNNSIIDLRVYDAANVEINHATADGETLITLEVTIPDNAADTYSTVTFRKSAGTFVGSSSDNIVKPIDEDGKARVKLKLPLGDQPLHLTAEIGSGGKLYIDEEDIELSAIEQMIILELTDIYGQQITGPVKADGVMLVVLKAKVMANVQEFSQVTFTSSNGTFLGNSPVIKNIDSNNEASVSLKMPKDVGPLYVSASVGTNAAYFDEKKLVLERAYPDIIVIEPASVSMNMTQGNQIKVYFLRNNGNVSTGTTATFERFQLIGGNEVPVGRFTGLANAATNSDGEIAVNFYADTGDIVDDVPITIRVTCRNDINEPISSNIVLAVN